MSNQLNEKNLSYALRLIVDKFGEETLLDASKVDAILCDLIPKNNMEKAWIIDAINLGITKILLDKNNIDQSSRMESRTKAKNLFKSYYIEDVRSEYVLDNLVYALKWSDKEVKDLSYYKNQSNKKQSTNTLNLKKQQIPKKVKNENNRQTNTNNDVNYQNKQNTNPRNVNRRTPNNRGSKLSKLIPIIIVLLLILLAKSFFTGDSVKVVDVNFNTPYEKQGDIYVFRTATPQVDFVLDTDDSTNTQYEKISYSIDDSNICSYLKLSGNRCLLNNFLNGTTTLRIYYDGEEIDSINIKFVDQITTQEPEYSEADLEELDLLVKGFWSNYSNAINFGDINYVSNYLTTSGDYYRELTKSIPTVYVKGTTIENVGFQKQNIIKENGYYRYCFTIEHKIYKTDESLYKKEYQEFIIKKQFGEWKIDRHQNYKEVDKYEI